jgi:C4-dicarboxylate transporter DctQ subunit
MVAEWLAGGLLLAATALVFANVIGRYVLGAPIPVAEEILQYMNVWVVMLGTALVTQRDAHLSLTLRNRDRPGLLRNSIGVVILLLTIVLSGYVVVQSVKAIGFFYAVDQRSISAGIPLSLLYVVIPLSFSCGLIFLLRRLWLLARGRIEEAGDDEEAPVSRTARTSGSS